MRLYRSWLRPALFKLAPEWVHDRAIDASRLAGSFGPVRWLLSRFCRYCDPRLECVVSGIRFPNPVGLAAGFDKNGLAAKTLAAMGFGHLEIGSISADPSPGNPKPRLWRLPREAGPSRAVAGQQGCPIHRAAMGGACDDRTRE